MYVYLFTGILELDDSDGCVEPTRERGRICKHNCKLFDMPPKELLDFRTDLVKLLICRSRYRKRPVVTQSSSHSRDGVPSGYSLCRVGEVGISRGKCRHCLDVGRRPVHHTTFSCSFVKFVSARFPVLQTIIRTELYVVSC